MSSRSNEEILKLKTEYKRLYNTELEADLIGDTSGYFRQLLVMQCKAERNDTIHVDLDQAHKGAVFKYLLLLVGFVSYFPGAYFIKLLSS